MIDILFKVKKVDKYISIDDKVGLNNVALSQQYSY